ncbi:MAG: hypothetical protein KDK45_13030, partial [Leptospiraceae bacterium]|nr:hypothetical protein [Leptospiraceae bacterium]
MKSKQINFFITPEDVLEIEKYLTKHNFLLTCHPLPTESIVLLDSLLIRNLENSFKIRGQKFIFREEDKSNLVIEYISTQKYYSVEISQSPVIEFLYPQMEPDVLRPGRLYFVKDYLDKIEMKEKMKAESFISAAEDLFKWFRKTFKNN